MNPLCLHFPHRLVAAIPLKRGKRVAAKHLMLFPPPADVLREPRPRPAATRPPPIAQPLAFLLSPAKRHRRCTTQLELVTNPYRVVWYPMSLTTRRMQAKHRPRSERA